MEHVIRPNKALRVALAILVAIGLACAAYLMRPPPLPPGFEGTFNLPGVDAMNLRIDAFGWESTLDGCDNWGQSEGRWEVVGDRLHLLPKSGEDRLQVHGCSRQPKSDFV